MKRIIDGVTYDTDTATEVFSEAHPSHFSMAHWGMFQTRHGAFFKLVCDHDGEIYTFTPLSDAEAQKLLERHANHLVEQFFGPFPEYGSAEKRITVRVPIGLARRVESAAKASNLDVNKYIQRCLEKAVKLDGQPPAVS
jgi:predicted DNA binding CopG/RHH family protein